MKPNNITITHSLIAADWDYESNGELKPEDVTTGQVIEVHWICPKGHPYEGKSKVAIFNKKENAHI